MLLTVEDYRRESQRRLPRAVFDFIDGGAEDEVTLRRNREAFGRIGLVPRVLADVHEVDTATSVLGRRLASPLLLAPTGLCGMATSRGEIPSARAAVEAGVIFTASCMSSVTLEEIAREAPGEHWFQLYVWRDRGLTRSLIDRAAAAGYRALVVTVDTPVLGRRERDLRNGATIPPRITVRNALDTLRRPRWLLTMARGPRPTFANVAGPSAGLRPFALSPFVNGLFDPTVTWADLGWIRGLWRGPLLVKGVMCAEDAREAVAQGAAGIVVSNHGGRQLDGAPATMEVLPEVVEAVGGEVEVLLDSGIRRGADVARALALGARACMVGRAYLYGLAVGRQQGVARVLGILGTELERSMALMGCARVADLGPDCVRPAGGRHRDVD
ncbi:MAG TPA: alpha-hydroxy acid oxidase [Candidatus Dormibacteraeota bacterium]|nr:alpha-hydroxy acid oxidase [Candidatus Dormibacteraeota bacterium]